jgi:inorganic pyrophosphatase
MPTPLAFSHVGFRRPPTPAGRYHIIARESSISMFDSNEIVMTKASARHTVLSDTASRDEKSGDYRAVIETPKGSRNKYRYDSSCDCFELATTLPEGMAFPFDFGFIPSTLGDDGDPLDVLVLMDSPVMAGCVLRCRLIGVIEAREKERGESWERNDRLIAVASHARTHEGVKTLTQLRAHTLEDIKGFFIDYNELHDKKFEVLGEHGPNRAAKCVSHGEALYSRK